STGAGGEFESLVKRLRGVPVPEGVGSRILHVGDAAFGLPDGGALPIEGALRTPNGATPPPVPQEFGDALRVLLNAPADRIEIAGDAEPLVAPPIYGARQAARLRIDDDAPVWLRTANLDPRHRAAAGFGTLVVQDQQEALMASAWEQLGPAGREQPRANQQALAREVLSRVHEQLASLSPEAFLRVTNPLHARVRLDTPQVVVTGDPDGRAPRTVREQVRVSSLPVAVTTATFQRVTRPLGPIMRRTVAPVTPAPVRTLSFAAHFTRPAPPVVSAPFAAAAAPGAVGAAAIEDRLRGLVVLSTRLGEAAEFSAAVRELSAYLANRVGGGVPPARPALDLDVLHTTMLALLEPAQTMPPPFTTPAPESPPTQPEPEVAVSAPRALPGPSFPQAMYEPLREIAPDTLLPGLDQIEPDTVTLLETNPAFIEAYMVGLNHEMSRELLWREYPSDLRATFFRRFWGGRLEMPEIHTWPADGDLGTQLSAGSDDQHLVLLIRGELLKRYPQTLIYAVSAVDRRTAGTERRYPVFRAGIAPDTTCLGFELSADEARGNAFGAGWFFVLEQPPGLPRFGLDASTVTGRLPDALVSWNDLAWGDLAESDDELAGLTHAPLAPRLAGRSITGVVWGLNAGHMAAITLQRPVRVLLHGADLLPPPEPADE
ncbi:MAG: hypothetical protein ACREM1_01325, partial [Longimicrobiales bacterium]